MSARAPGGRWRPTSAHNRCMILGVALSVTALLLNRPDVLVVATPFITISLWSVVTRPEGTPHATYAVSASRLREGERSAVVLTLTGADTARHVVALLPPSAWLETDPPSGLSAAAVSGGSAQPTLVSWDIRSTRWGERRVGPVLVAAFGEWGAYRWGPLLLQGHRQLTLPRPTVFNSAAPTPRPSGLVGLNRSRRPGDGSEFASIRPFQLGDRLRRIHWPVSLRTGDLHVTSTWADQDSQVILVVDATSDLGESEGIDGAASSLDVTVRAAGAVAHHYLRRGDRVGLRIFGPENVSRVRARSGRNHLDRLLDALALVKPGLPRSAGLRAEHFGLEAGALVILLTPLMSRAAIYHASTLVAHGLTVVVVDTLPPSFLATAEDDAVALARRIRLLSRESEIRQLGRAGVPIAPWRGPGSLDQLLHDVARRSAAPRVVGR